MTDLCPCCSNQSTTPLYTVRGAIYVTCTGCGSARLDPLPATTDELYGEHYFVGGEDHGGYTDYDADAELHARNGRARLRRMRAAVADSASTGDAIDVGCASGYTLDAYRDAGYTAHGVDASAWARRRAGERGHDAYASLPGALAACRELRVVSFFQSLEHLVHPDAAIAKAVAALPPGGVLAIETWDRTSRIARLLGERWHQANPPSVLHLFSRAGLQRMAERHGLTVHRLGPTPKLVSPALAVGVVAHRLPRVGRPLLRALDVTRAGRIAVPYRLGDLVTLMAVKR